MRVKVFHELKCFSVGKLTAQFALQAEANLAACRPAAGRADTQPLADFRAERRAMDAAYLTLASGRGENQGNTECLAE